MSLRTSACDLPQKLHMVRLEARAMYFECRSSEKRRDSSLIKQQPFTSRGKLQSDRHENTPFFRKLNTEMPARGRFPVAYRPGPPAACGLAPNLNRTGPPITA